MFDAVLVGVDFGPGGGEAVALARHLVAPGGRLTLGHVIAGDASVYRGQSQAYMAGERVRVAGGLERRLRALRAAAAPDGQGAGPALDTACLPAPGVGRGLHLLAERRGADLIVVGASRRGALGRILLGDDTRAVLRRAPCPVAVAPRGYPAGARLLSVGVGYDGSAESRRAVGLARALAAERGADLAAATVVSAVPGAPPLSITQALQAERRRADDALAALGDVEPHVLWGGDVDGLAAFGRRLDLLVVGSHALAATGPGRLGSTSARLARTAGCPVLVLMEGRAGAAGARVGGGDREGCH